MECTTQLSQNPGTHFQIPRMHILILEAYLRPTMFLFSLQRTFGGGARFYSKRKSTTEQERKERDTSRNNLAITTHKKKK
jgi:hypothetical protein